MADFRINVIVDPKRAVQGTRSVERGLTRIENRADSTRVALRRAFLVFGGTGLAFVAIRTLAQFEQSMSTVRAVTGATEQEFRRLTATAQELGITTRFTAGQAADAMVNLARAGFSVEEALEAVSDTLKLAQAGGLGLALAADIAASTLRGFRLETDQAARVTDVLTLAANSANTTVGQLGDAIKFVAPIAAGLGVTLETTSAALGTLSDAGLKASLAGTGLRRVLAELESPASNTQKILSNLGVSTDEVRVSQVGLVAALERLKEAGIDTGTALEIFGQRGGPAFEVLVNNIPRVIEMTEALENAAGTAAEVARIMDENLNGALLRTKSALEGVVLAFGQIGGGGALTQTFEGIATAFRFLAENIRAVTDTLIVFGATVLSIKLIELGASAAASAKGFLQLRAAVASGTAVVLGSAEAERQRTLALVQETEAQLASTTATLTDLRAKSAHTAAMIGGGNAIKARAVLLEQTALVEKQVAVQTAALTGAQVRLAAATAASTAQATLFSRAWVRANTSISSSIPILVVAGAAMFTVSKIMEGLSEDLEELKKNFDDLEKDAAFSRIGQQIAGAQRELNNLNKIAAAQGGLSEGQQARVEQLTSAINALRAASKNQLEDNREIRAAREAANVTADNTIAKLDREIASLQSLNRETDIRLRAEEEIDRLLQSGQIPTGGQREAIESRLRSIELLKDQAQVLEDIKGPQDQFARNLAALEALQARGAITAKEYTDALSELRGEFDAGEEGADLFAEQVKGLQEANKLLEDQIRLGSVSAEAARIERELAEQGTMLNREQQDQLVGLLLAKQALKDEQEAINEKDREALKLLRDKERLEQQQEQRTEALIARFDLEFQLLDLARELNLVLAQRPDLQEAVNKTLREAELAALDASTALEDGFTRAFIRISAEAEDFAAVAESAVNAFADNATNALVEFARTGKLSFKEFAASLIDDLIQIIARLLIVQALSAIGGGGLGAAAGVGGAIAGGRQHGGTVQPGRSFIVGENGPEIFQPEQTGTIVPNAADAPQATVENKLSIVNVMDPDMVPSAINDGEADDAIINVLQRNRNRVNNVLG